MKSYNGLLAIAEERKTTGQIDIDDFVSNKMKKYSTNLLLIFHKCSQPRKSEKPAKYPELTQERHS